MHGGCLSNLLPWFHWESVKTRKKSMKFELFEKYRSFVIHWKLFERPNMQTMH